MSEAQLHETHEGFVSYFDTGAGVFLAWNAQYPRTIHIISQDNRRTLGEFETSARTIESAAATIIAEINALGKPYGERAGLWESGADPESVEELREYTARTYPRSDTRKAAEQMLERAEAPKVETREDRQWRYFMNPFSI